MGGWGSVLKRPHRVLLTSMYLLLYIGKRKILRQREAPVAQMIKNLPAMQEMRVQSLGQQDPLERKWKPTPISLPGKSHGQRSLVGYNPGRPWKNWTGLSH